MNRISRLLVFCLLAACSRSRDDALKTAAAIRTAGSSATTASDDPVCKLFSSGDAVRYVGKPTNDAETAIGGCQWAATERPGSMIVQVVRPDYHEKPENTPGYRVLPGVGTDGFVAPYMGGWTAGALTGKHAIHVTLSGEHVTEASTIALLQDAIKRYGASVAQ